MTTKQLTHFINFFNKFECKVEQGQIEDLEYNAENYHYGEDVPFIRFDDWLTIYHDESTHTFIVEHIISVGDEWVGEDHDYKTFCTTNFCEALTYAGSRMIEWDAQSFADKLADDEERKLFSTIGE